MLLKKLSIFVFITVLSAVVFTSCKEDDPAPEPSVVTEGAYILNSGVQTGNDSEISYYDFATQNVKNNVYFTQNSTLLGDTGNDFLICGSKTYCAVTVSGKIAVMDKNGKLIKNIQSEKNGKFQEPRNLTAFEGKIYVTFKDGYVACIDTASLTIEKQVKVGEYPEQLAVANRKLYVANSGGFNFPDYDKTVSVISIDNFSVLKTLEVVPNPVKVQIDAQGDVYVASFNSYEANGALQRIDSKTDAVTKIDGFSSIADFSQVCNDKIYIIQTQYDENWDAIVSYSVFDTKNEKVLTEQFITDGTMLTSPGCINVEPVSGNVYIGDSPTFTGNGDIYIFSPDGKLVKKFDSGAKNPVKVCFVTK
ncbi:hypothetical protein FACS1894203_3130 [Bacteroidia bacterium]|nr:hypothetical protein FACS1894203_3130 [Bacteroidia bacterium]